MKNILIIDDNRLIINSLSWGLGACSGDWRIMTALNGEEGVKILQSEPVDLVLTDLQMPVMDGYSLLAYARKHHPSIPAIAMTARYTVETKRRLGSLGITRAIEKPFSLKALAAAIADILKNDSTCGEFEGLPCLKTSFCS